VLVTVDGLGYDKRGTASHRGIGLATGAASARRRQMAMQTRNEGAGWRAFAGVMLIIVGLLDVVDGLWALDRSDTKINGLLYADKLGGWGWYYLILGIVLVLAGIGVFYRSQLARWVGIILGSIAVVSNMLWVFVFPITSLVVMFLAVLVVYGLVVYGEPETA
jgi:uncharacterized membrane protein YidH (DUF202 family)